MDGSSAQDWSEMECRMQYLEAQAEEAAAALARKHAEQAALVDRAERAEVGHSRLFTRRSSVQWNPGRHPHRSSYTYTRFTLLNTSLRCTPPCIFDASKDSSYELLSAVVSHSNSPRRQTNVC